MNEIANDYVHPCDFDDIKVILGSLNTLYILQ